MGDDGCLARRARKGVFSFAKSLWGGVDSWQRIKGGGSGQVAVRIGAAGAP